MEALAKENGQNLQNAKKPRLKWSAELHDQFLKAVYQLGGAHEATPKEIQKRMGIEGITSEHIKSHLQKYRLGEEFHARAKGTVMILEVKEQNTHRRTIGCQTIDQYMQTTRGKSLLIEEQSQLNKRNEDTDLNARQDWSSKTITEQNSHAQEAKSSKHQVYEPASASDQPTIHPLTSEVSLCQVSQRIQGHLSAGAKDDYAERKSLNEIEMKTEIENTFASEDCKLCTKYKPFDLNVSAEGIRPTGGY